MLPRNNAWAVVGGLVTAAVVAALQAFVTFFQSGQPWPETTEGWLKVVIPAIAAGLLAALVPSASLHEAKYGYRVTGPRDAPVLNTASEHFRELDK